VIKVLSYFAIYLCFAKHPPVHELFPGFITHIPDKISHVAHTVGAPIQVLAQVGIAPSQGTARLAQPTSTVNQSKPHMSHLHG
jgi:hypothetical protein